MSPGDEGVIGFLIGLTLGMAAYVWDKVHEE
jgi:hypothetical protein